LEAAWPQTERAASVRFSPDGQFLLAALDDRTAKLWGLAHRPVACPPLSHPAKVVNAEFLKTPAWIVTATADGSVRMWDPRDGRGHVAADDFAALSQRGARA